MNKATAKSDDEVNSLKNLSDILDKLDDAIFVCDPGTYKLLYVNKAFKDIWGSRVIGKSCHEVLREKPNSCDFCKNDNLKGENSGKKYIHEFQHKKNGKWFRCTNKAIKWEGKIDARIESMIDITDKKEIEEDLKNRSSMLAERVKELNCLYSARSILQDTDKDYSEVFSEILNIIPPGWQYPESTVAKIIYDGMEYHSNDWNDSLYPLSADIMHDSDKIGEILVAYAEEKPLLDEGPFLSEERDLINNLAMKIGNFIERKQQEEELKGYKESLEKIVEERTQKLKKLNQKLEQELQKGRKKEDTIRRQAEEILELSTPVLKLWDGVIAATLIGSMDSTRSDKFQQRLLQKIDQYSAKTVIIDITGVPDVDTKTAQNIIETINSSKLMGARVIVTGIRPQIAQTIVQLGIDLTGYETLASIESGLKRALSIEE